ncbi:MULTISPECIES: hypothetical protein [Flavobacterium]|uniref:hypothetical protein n=1 Tax=Flavobacterium TaxID=237 RepID=UPI0021142EAA|nr:MULTISPECIES: hypothetical protein [Flavobacterium]UUF15369.1 hypothetical protein NLJ00_04485 [Flavobacterium panici]
MKIIKATFILTFLSFKLFAQIDFPQDIIVKNRIVKASKYLIIPKLNSDFNKKSKGLKLESETVFDDKGHIISVIHPKGAVASHSDVKDIKQYYFYDDERIIRMSRIDFDSTSVEYLYFDKKNIVFKIKTDNKNHRIGLELTYSNANNGKEERKIEIDFRNTSFLNNSTYLYKTKIIYSKNIKQIKVSRKLFDISQEQLNILKSSNDIESIENELREIDGSNFLDDINYETLFVYNKGGQLMKEVSEDRTVEYIYDKKGLVMSCNIKSKYYSFISKFVYSTKKL